METELDELLASIDPSRTLDETAARADEAVNSFDPGTGVITDWVEFQDCLGSLYCHVENHVLRLRSPREPDMWMDWGRCCRLLLDEYGADGEKAAFEMARTGNEGGLLGVQRTVAKHIAEQYAATEISAIVSSYLNGLTAQEQLDAADEYVEKFGDLLPSELTEGNAVRIKISFFKTLEQHPRMMQRLRRVGR